MVKCFMGSSTVIGRTVSMRYDELLSFGVRLEVAASMGFHSELYPESFMIAISRRKKFGSSVWRGEKR